jgi:polar amino acid transport system permease protein
MSYQWDFSWLPGEFELLLRAAWVSVQILAISAVISMAFGLLLGEGLLSHRWYIAVPVRLWVELFRLTPPLLQIVLIFFFLPVLIGRRMSAFEAGVIALSFNYAAFFAEIFRAGVISLSKGQREAANAMGMTGPQAWRRVVLPQVVRRMLPPITSMLVNLTKDTSLLTILGVTELFNVSQSVAARNFRSVEVLLVLAAFYLVINVPLAGLSNWLYQKQAGKI